MAGERLGRAVLELGTNDAGFDQGIDRAKQQAEGLQGVFDRASKGIDHLGDNLISAGGTMTKFVSGPIAGLGAGLIALASSSASAGNEIAKSAREAGMSADSFQELRFALGQVSQASEGEVQRSLLGLTRRMGEAVQGNDSYADALGRLGIDLGDVANGAVGTEQVFEALVRRMQEAPTAAQAAAEASELLGDRVGPKLAAALREGGANIDALRERAHELNIVLGDEALAAAETYTDASSEMWQSLEAVGRQLGAELLPVLVDFSGWMTSEGIPLLRSFAEGIGGVIEWFQALPGPAQEALGTLAVALGAGGPVLIALGIMAKAFAAIIAVATGPIGLFIGAAVLASVAWAKWGDEIKLVIGGALDWLTDKFAVFTDAMAAVTDRVAGAWSWLKDTLVGNSIIPDMWESIEDWFDRGGRSIESKTAALTKQTAQNFGQMAAQAASDLQQMSGALATHSRAMFHTNKVAGIAQAIISTHQGIAAALKLGWPLGVIAAAKVGAMGFAQVAAIRGASFGGGGGGGKGAGIGAVGALAAPTVAEAPAVGQEDQSRLINIQLQSRRTRFDREEVLDLMDQINDALGDNAQLRFSIT